MKCANEGRLGFLQHLPWSICFDRLWLDGGKTFYANYLLHSASIKWCFKRRRTEASLSRLAWLSLEKGVAILATMLHKSSGSAARDWLHVLWEPTFHQRVCHRREENVWGQVIGVMEAKIKSELEGVSGLPSSFVSSLEALVVKSKLHLLYIL